MYGSSRGPRWAAALSLGSKIPCCHFCDLGGPFCSSLSPPPLTHSVRSWAAFSHVTLLSPLRFTVARTKAPDSSPRASQPSHRRLHCHFSLRCSPVSKVASGCTSVALDPSVVGGGVSPMTPLLQSCFRGQSSADPALPAWLLIAGFLLISGLAQLCVLAPEK